MLKRIQNRKKGKSLEERIGESKETRCVSPGRYFFTMKEEFHDSSSTTQRERCPGLSIRSQVVAT